MTTKKQTLGALTKDFTVYLKKYRSQSTLYAYQWTWNKVEAYMAKKKIKYYDAKVGDQFLKWWFGAKYSFELLASYRQKNFASRVEALADFQKLGTIVMGSRFRVSRVFNGEIGKSMTDFIEHRVKSFGLAKQTSNNYKIYLYKFYLFLKNKGTHYVNQISKEDIIKFIGALETRRFAARHLALSIVKRYTTYLFDQGVLNVDYARTLPNDNYKQQAHLPSTYSEGEINNFLRSIDRGSPKGKRDYALFLLAIKLGIRSSDIRNLKFENISWDNNAISFEQQKTGKPLTLPLPAEVGNAIIDYLKFGRPVSKESYCFLSIIAPFKKMGSNDIKNLVEFYLKRAKVNINNRSHGPHALRHSFATHLLNSKTPLPIISEALGHTVTASTMFYLRVDTTALRQCALDVPATPVELYKTKGGYRG